MSSTYFVAGATGSQGGATARELRRLNKTVHTIARNPLSVAAQELVQIGVKVFPGDFDSQESLKAACVDVVGVFINVYPVFTDRQAELRHAENILAAARSSGKLQVVVYTSVVDTGKHESFPGWNPDSFLGTYYLSKHGIEELVRNSGLSYTILRPPFLMKNLLLPQSSMQFPELSKQGLLRSAYKPDTKMAMLDEYEVGVFAAAALTDQPKFRGKEIELAIENLTLDEMARQLSEASGKPIKTVFLSDDEAQALKDVSPIVASQLLRNEIGVKVDYEALAEYDLTKVTFSQYLKNHREEVQRSFEAL